MKIIRVHETQTKIKEVLSELKKIASECSDNPTRIISSCTENLPPEVTGALPCKRAIEIQYHKRKNESPAANPESLTALVIPATYQRTKRSEPFLVHDSGPSEERLLIFSTDRSLQFLQN